MFLVSNNMEDFLEDYSKNIQKVRNRGKEWKISDEDIDKIINDSFKFIESDSLAHVKGIDRKKNKWMVITIMVTLTVSVLACCYYRKTTNSLLEKHIQDVIYPTMKFLRQLMLPILKIFPSVTEWYDEACLVSNPYFKVTDLECWPCENVKSILNLTLTNLDNDVYHSGIPFVIKESHIKNVNFKMLRSVYYSKKEMFDKDGPRIEHSHGLWRTPKELFEQGSFEQQSPDKDYHIVWKLNRLEPTREIRSLFGMPKRLPNYVAGATPEKFILLDESKSLHYYLPTTEGSNVFVIQGCGTRLFILEPTKECSKSCHRVSMLLKPNHILWFNWWYWRAISIPMGQSTKLSITYLGSYF